MTENRRAIFTDKEGRDVFVLHIMSFGDNKSGKTSLMKRFTEDTYSDNYVYNGDANIKSLTIDDNTFKLLIWDVIRANICWCCPPTKVWFRMSHGFLLVFDVTSKSSFKYIKRVVGNILVQRQNTSKYYGEGNNIPRLVVGTKCDLIDQREVLSEDARDFAAEHDMLYIETSAKTGCNVELMYVTLVTLILDKLRECGMTMFPLKSDAVEEAHPSGLKNSKTSRRKRLKWPLWK